MKTAKTITHILFPVFIGLIIGGAIFKNTSAWVSGIVLLIIDIIVGVILQYFIQKPLNEFNYKSNNSSKLYFDSIGGTVERCKELFKRAEILLNSEFNDYLFGIDLNGNKRPLASKHNELLQEILDSSLDAAAAAYLNIDDIIVYPWQRLKKSIQKNIIQDYGEVTPYTTFLFLNDYFAEKYNLILVVYKNQETHFATIEPYIFNL
ncbi:MAG: hypothetical protein K2N23_03545 [Clostridia bacterium]|nr:hypothetical protein [Clostridia bacterium]